MRLLPPTLRKRPRCSSSKLYAPALLIRMDISGGLSTAALTTAAICVANLSLLLAWLSHLRTANHTSLSDAEFVAESQAAISPKYLTSDTSGGRWGSMTEERWAAFVGFLSEAGILTGRDGAAIPLETLDVAALFTNEFLPSA